MYRIYLYAVHLDFDPQAFNDQLPRRLKGSIKWTKKFDKGINTRGEQYWDSKILTATRNPEEKLSQLLHEYSPYIVELRKRSNASLFACLVATFPTKAKISGYYFSSETLALLAKLNIHLDIDQYCRPSIRA